MWVRGLQRGLARGPVPGGRGGGGTGWAGHLEDSWMGNRPVPRGSLLAPDCGVLAHPVSPRLAQPLPRAPARQDEACITAWLLWLWPRS